MVSSILQVEIDNRGCSDMIRQLIGETTKLTAQRRRRPRASPAARPRVATDRDSSSDTDSDTVKELLKNYEADSDDDLDLDEEDDEQLHITKRPRDMTESDIFLNDEQLHIITNITNMRHTLLIGDYGTGQ